MSDDPPRGDRSTGRTDDQRRADTLGPDEAYCRDCGAVINRRAEVCPACGVRQRSADGLADVLDGGDPVAAAVLSAVFPGMGQLYNRELKRGIAVMIASFLAVLSVLVGIGLVLFPAVYVYGIYDAYTRAERAFAQRQGSTVT